MATLFIMTLVGSLATSFLLSGMEAGVLALSRLRIRQLMRKGNARARALYGYLEHPENFLWTIMVGNIVSNVLAFSLSVIALYFWLSPWPLLFWIAVVLAVGVFYAFFESLPKALFRLYPNRLCLLLATPFRALHLFLRPLVATMALVSRYLGGKRFTGDLFGNRDELRLVMQESAQSLTTEEQTMINRVMDLQLLKVQHIAIPLSQAVMVSVDTPLCEVMDLCRRHGLSRLPVWQGEEPNRRIVGLLSLRALLFQENLDLNQPARAWVVPAHYLSGETRLDVALRHLQRYGQRLAIVLGADRRETGIVSMQDILKTIFGEVSL